MFNIYRRKLVHNDGAQIYVEFTGHTVKYRVDSTRAKPTLTSAYKLSS